MSLRIYQDEALSSSREERQANIWAQLTVLPTGSGKMCCIANLPKYHQLGRGEAMLFFAHRDRLLDQAAEKLRKYNPDLRVAIHSGRYDAPTDCDVVVASVQTIGRMVNGAHTKRIKRFDPDRFRIIVSDESHHLLSPSHMNVLRYFRVLKDEEPDTSKLLSCWTATPERTDQRGLEKVCQKIVYSRDVRSMINEGWLARISAYRVTTDADISNVKTRKGDWVPEQLSKALNTDERNALVIDKYLEYGRGEQAIAFPSSVEHGYALSAMFQDRGITSFMVSDQTPRSDRLAAYAAFESGRCRILLGFDTLTEGADFPMASIGLGVRPTMSGLIFRQMVGRILRPYPAPEDASGHTGWKKTEATWLDFVDVTGGKHSLNTIPTLFGLNAQFDAKGRDVLEQVEEIEKLQAEQPRLDLKSLADIEAIRHHVANVDLLEEPVVPPVVRQHSRFEWLQTSRGTLRLALPDKGVLEICINLLGYREVYRVLNGTRALHCVVRNLAEALKEGDKLIPRSVAAQIGTDSGWTIKEPTEKGCRYLWTLDRDIRTRFPTEDGVIGPLRFYEFALAEYRSGKMMWSRGAIGSRINRHTATRDQKQPFVAGQRRG